MKNAPIAYQIYSARKEAEQDLLSVLRQLKALGYDGVEFAGFYGHSAQDVRAMLEECGLRAVSSHVALKLIEADMQGVIDYHKAIGCDYIAVPYLSTEQRPGTPAFAGVLRTIYQFGCLCRDNGIQLLYHNHDFEFVSFSGMYALDFLYAAMPEDVLKTEIDVCWVKYAGEDPAAYLRKYAGRAPVVHLKDFVGNIMCRLADKVSPASEISGACNTIVNDNGVLTAYTTDGVGFMRAVAEKGVDIIGKKMTLLGAGGAATAILVQAALDGVAEINVFNVKDAFYGRAEEIVAKLNERTNCKVTLHDFSDPEVLRASIADSAILVNGTSVGMAPKTENTIITDTTMFHKDLFVFDVIYNPQETRLLREAKEAGCKTGNGMYMLLYQGAASFKLWTGMDMPVEIIKEKYFSKG